MLGVRLCVDELKVMNRNELAAIYHLPMDMRARADQLNFAPNRSFAKRTPPLDERAIDELDGGEAT